MLRRSAVVCVGVAMIVESQQRKIPPSLLQFINQPLLITSKHPTCCSSIDVLGLSTLTNDHSDRPLAFLKQSAASLHQLSILSWLQLTQANSQSHIETGWKKHRLQSVGLFWL